MDTAGRRRGPPNRMNDLSYTEWMKFQKSFFRHRSCQSLVEECVYFFTKAQWPDGRSSRSLILGVDGFQPRAIPPPRVVETRAGFADQMQIVKALTTAAETGAQYDFILVDLRGCLPDCRSLSRFLGRQSDAMFGALRRLLREEHYCGVLVGPQCAGAAGFPIPWAVALSCRGSLRLRDEKIALVEDEGRVFYCLFMQAAPDERPPCLMAPDEVRVTAADRHLPAWIIPKPPPRKKNEVLHPAKYPETLVAEFIETFTSPGGKVFDPMMGTGSTLVAAVRSGRSGYGVDLIPEFVEIARQRLQNELVPATHHLTPPPTWLALQGDAARLNEVEELSSLQFDYVITSPPYWSMLTNPGSENQEARRSRSLPLVYSTDERDLGNTQDYDAFLAGLRSVYEQVVRKLRPGGHLTVVVKNVKRNHILYPLAWDLVRQLCGPDGCCDYVGNTFWCQDDVGLKPFAVGIHWVSNVLHQYCLHFRRR